MNDTLFRVLVISSIPVVFYLWWKIDRWCVRNLLDIQLDGERRRREIEEKYQQSIKESRAWRDE